MISRFCLSLAAACVLGVSSLWAQSLTVAATTSTANSGFLEFVTPLAEADLGFEIRFLAVGTGRALRLLEQGDVDAALVHDVAGELSAVGAGHAQSRRPVMRNEFIILGPADDTLLDDVETGAQALKLIQDEQRPFISRGDDSGTHRAELRLWGMSGQMPPSGVTDAASRWYRETGQGMGASLTIAAGMQAYILSDTSTWASHGLNQRLSVKVMGDPEMANPYGYLVGNAGTHPHLLAQEAERFGDWLRSQAGREAIAGFQLGGMSLFEPLF